VNRITNDRLESLDNYQDQATQFARYPGKATVQGLAYTALGLVGEAGEIANKTKKVLRDDSGTLTEMAKDALIGEAGDVLWYLAALCNELGVSLEFVAQYNLKKLSSREQRGALQGSGDNR
jgi:NTP pyrophosphatase (non-canonical NTP hydrolase)